MSRSRKLTIAMRILRFGFVNLFRNAWLTIAATAVMVVALTIISIAVVLNVTANNAISVIGLDLNAEIYLVEETPEDRLSSFRADLRQLDIVENIKYVSPEEAAQRLVERQSEDEQAATLQALALVGGEESALEPSLQVSVNDLERMPEIKAFAESDEYADIVASVSVGQDDNSAQDTIDTAVSAQRFINAGGFVSAGVLAAVSVMIIFNTIRMAIYTRRDEIRIMKLIGATPDYIRGPFLVEASLYGVIAGLMASGVVYSLVFFLGERVSDQRHFSQTYAFFTEPGIIVVMTVSAVLIGLLIGIVSSMLAMERHLKLKNW